jgi:hypothetical protein
LQPVLLPPICRARLDQDLPHIMVT